MVVVHDGCFCEHGCFVAAQWNDCLVRRQRVVRCGRRSKWTKSSECTFLAPWLDTNRVFSWGDSWGVVVGTVATKVLCVGSLVRPASSWCFTTRTATWLILPVVIRSSQRLSHASLSINPLLWNCEWLIISVIVYLIVPYYLDNRSNSRANTCVNTLLG